MSKRGVGLASVVGIVLGAVSGAALSGCADLFPVTAEADAAFRRGLIAQIGGDAGAAEREYRHAVELDANRAAAWNNLGVMAALGGDEKRAIELVAKAVAADAGDLTALTNYGVLRFRAGDYAEARRALSDVRSLRQDTIEHTSSGGRVNWDNDLFARATAALDERASRYLKRIETAEHEGVDFGENPPTDLVAERGGGARF